MAHGDITHVDIPVEDMDRATSFYHSVLGWEIEEMPGFDGYPMWRGPNALSGGGFVQRQEGFQHVRSYVEVDSIDHVLGAVTAAGGTIDLEKTEITPTSWYAVFKDTEGNQFGLFEGTTE